MRKVQTHSQQQQRQALLENQKPGSAGDEVGGLRREPRMTTVVAPTSNGPRVTSNRRPTDPSPFKSQAGFGRPHLLEIDWLELFDRRDSQGSIKGANGEIDYKKIPTISERHEDDTVSPRGPGARASSLHSLGGFSSNSEDSSRVKELQHAKDHVDAKLEKKYRQHSQSGTSFLSRDYQSDLYAKQS